MKTDNNINFQVQYNSYDDMAKFSSDKQETNN